MMSSQNTPVSQVGTMKPMDQHKPRCVTYKKYRRAKLHRNNENLETCPECGAKTVTDLDHCEIYCHDCGLVVKASISYVGVKRVCYPYGTLL